MTDPRVDAYIEDAEPFAKPILRHLRALVHKACPDVRETMKWRFPHFDYKGMFCSMAGFKAHCTFGFWKHRVLVERGLASPDGNGMAAFGRIATRDDLPSDRRLLALIRAAAALNDDGVKAPRKKPTARPPVKAPADLIRALRASSKARATFETLTPSHRREYVDWITEAKTDATRQRRIAITVGWLASGKQRNWKYA